MSDEMMAEPDWLAAQQTDREKLRAIMDALARCFLECPDDGEADPAARTGPHITTSMAEIFLAQMMTAADTELAQIRADLAAVLGFASFRNAPLAPVQRLLAAARHEVYGEDS